MNQYHLYISQYYTVAGVKPKYKSSQVNTFKQFLNYCSDNNLSIREFTSGDAQNYLEYLKSKTSRLDIPLSPSRINNFLVVTSIFYNELVKVGEVKSNPFSAIRRLKVDKITNSFGANSLELEQVKDLFNVAENLRDKVILHLFYSTGLRRAEAQEVTLKDVDFRNNQIIVTNGKGDKKRIVPVSSYIMDDIKDYIFTERDELLNGKHSESLIVSRLSLKTRGGTMYKRILELKELAEITEKVTPHILRASVATHMLNNGMKAKNVQRLLGHSTYDVTSIYTNQNNLK